GAAHLDVAGAEIVVGPDHFLERSDLPGDLVQGNVAVRPVIAEKRAHRLVGEKESVMVGAVCHEKDARFFHLLRRLAHEFEGADIDLVGHAEAEQPRIEIDAGAEIADIVAAVGRIHGFVLLPGILAPGGSYGREVPALYSGVEEAMPDTAPPAFNPLSPEFIRDPYPY